MIKTFFIGIVLLFLATPLRAGDSNYHQWPQQQGAEPAKKLIPIPKLVGEVQVGTGLWLPDGQNFKDFFGNCCTFWNRVQGGVLLQRRYGLEGSVGFVYQSGSAQGLVNGLPSSDSFKLYFVPTEISAVFRADYFDWRGLIPFAKVGGDGVYYRESTDGNVVSGFKYGFHGSGGLQLNLLMVSDSLYESREEYGIQDAFFKLEAAYHKINNFGSSSLNLSGVIYSAGFLFYF